MKTHHVTIDGSELRFRFKGKSGQAHDILMKEFRGWREFCARASAFPVTIVSVQGGIGRD